MFSYFGYRELMLFEGGVGVFVIWTRLLVFSVILFVNQNIFLMSHTVIQPVTMGGYDSSFGNVSQHLTYL